MQSFSCIIDAFGGPAPFGAAIGVTDSHARTMKTRDSIAPEHWVDVVQQAAIKRVDGISFELLAHLAAQRKRRAPVSSSPIEAGI